MLQEEGLDGLLYVPHAGELPTEPNLQEALAECPPLPSRIAHGIEAQSDSALVSKLIKHDICCGICVTSNEQLGACSPGRHPIMDLVRAGVPCSISPDDPLLFSVDVCQEYERVQRLGAQPQELVLLARNSISYAGTDPRLRRRWIADLDAWVSQHIQQAPLLDLLQQPTKVGEQMRGSLRCGYPRSSDGNPCRHRVSPGQRCPDHKVT